MPAVETVDCACQTDGDDLGVDGALYDLEEDPDIPVLPEMVPPGTAGDFLSSVNRMQVTRRFAPSRREALYPSRRTLRN